MCGERMPQRALDLMQGTVDVLILKTLSWQPLHGYAIAKWIEQRSGGVLGVADAALYQAKRSGRNQICIARALLSFNFAD